MISPVEEAALLKLVRETARADILPHFRRLTSASISTKTGPGDLVTIADTAAERRIFEGVRRLLPNAMIIGEEAVSADASLLDQLSAAELAVIVDPIDGTWNFAKGLPLFGVMLAVVKNGSATFGLIYDPVTDTSLIAHAGKGAQIHFPDGTNLRLSIDAETDGTIGFVPIHFIPRLLRHHMTPIFEGYDRILSFRCSAHEYWMLSAGSTDFCLSAQLKPWDHAAGELIYRESGGYAAMLEDGTPYAPTKIKGHLLSARNRRHWEKLRQDFAFLSQQ